MGISNDEAVALGQEVEALVKFLQGALRKDADGKPRLDKAETKELIRRLGHLLACVTRDMLD